VTLKGRRVTDFTVKDSGVIEEYASGMRRDTQDGKTLFSLVFKGPMLTRWAEHLTKGAVKYGKNNWTLAGSNSESAKDEYDRFVESAVRHFVQWMNGERDEDHAAAVFFNINAAEYTASRHPEVRA
jgi:hypothetical protein